MKNTKRRKETGKGKRKGVLKKMETRKAARRVARKVVRRKALEWKISSLLTMAAFFWPVAFHVTLPPSPFHRHLRRQMPFRTF